MNRLRLQIQPRRNTRGAEGERGQVLVLFTIVLVVILAFTALVVDIGLLRNDRQSLVNAMDAGALAGGTLMPVAGSKSGAAAEVTALVNKTVQATYPGLSNPRDYTITYRCLIGTGAGNPAAFDSADIAEFIPYDCNPRLALGHSPGVGDFTGAGKTRSSICRPDLGDKCNVVVVEGNVTTPYSFARVVGVNSGSTGVVQSAACKGLCGELPTKYDVELVIDKSGSMQRNCSGGASDPRVVSPPNRCENVANSRSRIGWAGFAAKQLVTDLDLNGGIGALHRVGITTFQGDPDETPVRVVSYDGKGGRQNAWTSTATQLKALIDNITNQGEGNTPTRAGMAAAVTDLNANARAAVNVKRVLILISDGRPQPDKGPNGQAAPNTSNPLTNQRPTQAGLAAYLGAAHFKYSIMIGVPTNPYPIGYVVTSGNLDNNILDPDLMKLLATPDDLSADPPLRYYYPVAEAKDLPGVFTQIAGQILGAGSRLVRLYPAPIVTGVSGGPTVSISGKYFTGATQVTFGGTNAAFTINSDTSITATAPSGTPGQTVHVRVTTSGGSSPAYQYTYP